MNLETVSAVMSFFIAMMNNPEIQRKAQEEIDQVVGNDRLPTFEDRSRMPFLTCLVWKTLRWNPVTPLAVPHATVQDDVYEGYLIPKGTTVLANAWSVPSIKTSNTRLSTIVSQGDSP